MAKIIEVEIHVPEEKITNLEISETFPKWTPEKIYEKTGISLRGKSSEGETAGDLSIKAAEKLFKKIDIKREQINMLIFVTQTPNQCLPSTSCEIHQSLKLNNSCGAFDVNQGCTGYIYGLYLAKSFIDNNSADYVLLLTGETMTKIISSEDGAVAPIFGDGASATLLGKDLGDNENKSIGDFEFGTDGTKSKYLYCDFGSLRKSQNDWHKLYMNGPGIMSFTLDIIPKAFNNYLDKYLIAHDDIDFVIFHQANKYILERLYRKLKIEDKGIICLEKYGNTTSSSIPFVLKELDLIKKNKKCNILLVGFGVGLSWGITKIMI